MGVLSSETLKKAIQEGLVSYKPNSTTSIAQRINEIEGCSYNVTLDEIYSWQTPIRPAIRVDSRDISGLGKVKPHIKKLNGIHEYILSEGAYVVTTQELFRLQQYFGIVVPRSSYLVALCPVIGTIINPGFEGHLRMLLYVHNQHGITLERGSEIAQVYFLQITEGEITPYSGIWKGEKVQTDGTERPK